MTENEFLTKMNESKYHSQGHLAMIKQAWKAVQNKNQDDVNKSLCWAANAGHKDLLEYLLKEPTSPIHADIHTEKDFVFYISMINNNYDILDFLIYNMKIEKTQNIIDYINEEKNEDVQRMFSVREKKPIIYRDFFIK